MNYKTLFKRALLLISSPAKAWEEIAFETDRRKVLGSFVYPMIGLCGFSVFLGSLFETGWGALGWQIALTKSCSVFVALFGGYFLTAYLINKLGATLFKSKDNLPLLQQFVGYSMVVTFLLDIISGIIPGFFILRWILQFYVIFVVWEGVRILLRVEEQKQMAYTVMASFFIVLCPALLGLVFNKLSFILN